MQAVTLHPRRWQISSQLGGLALCVAAMLAFPPLCLPVGLLLPLFACPLIGRRQQWAAWLAVPLPALIAFLNGADGLYSLSLLLPCGLPVAAASCLRASGKDGGPVSPLFYICAYAAALTAVLACASRLVGGNLADGLAQRMVQFIASSSDAGLRLYRLAASGVIGMPGSVKAPGALAFALDPALSRQLLLSLHLALRESLFQLLPSLFVQCAIIGGLFTALRAQKLNHAYLLVGERATPGSAPERVHIAVAPGFCMLSLPRGLRLPTLLMGLGALLCSLSAMEWVQQLGILFYATFLCVYELVGAAVLVCLLSARLEWAKPLFGLLAGVLYLVFPASLFLIGVLDPILHFRSKMLLQQEEE